MTMKLLGMTHRGRGRRPLATVVWLAAGVTLAALACGPKPPPPHIVEVPIDQFDNGVPRPAPTAAPEATVAVAETPAPSGGNGTRPSALATQAPASTSGVPAGQHLSAADCDKVLDKGAIQYGVSKGTSVTRAMRSIPQLRTQAQADSTFAAVTSGCTKDYSKTQFSCGMKATSFDKWKACMEAPP